MKKINKHIFKLLSACLLLVFVVTSCDDEDFTGASVLTPTNPTITVSAPSAITIDEQDTTFTFAVTMSEPQIVDVLVYVFAVEESSTATLHDDYDLNNTNGRVFISAGSTTGTATVTLYADGDTRESSETLVVQIGDGRTANAQMTPATVTFTINNTPSFAALDYVEVTMTWDDGESLAPDGESSYCDVVDYDFFILPEGSGSTADDVTTGMATGACPEGSNLDLADGAYNVYKLLYNDGSGATPDWGNFNFAVPLTVTITRYNNDGSIAAQASWTEDPDLGQALTTEADNHDAFFYLGDIVVAGGQYSFEHSDGDSTDPVEIEWINKGEKK